jgi:hypothetical protein
MTITVETITEIDDDVFNTLYADSLADMGAGSMPFPDGLDAAEKKAFVKTMLEKDTMVLFKKDTIPVSYASGYIRDTFAYYENGGKDDDGKHDPTKAKHNFTNLFHWTHSVMGNVGGNKDWIRTSELFQAMKDYLVSEHSVDGMLIDAIKGKALATSFKQSQANGVCQGTYSLNNAGSTASMVWVY